MQSRWAYLFVGALFLAMVSGSLLTTGMFMDGLIYSNVARNMAEGIGSFWHPVYTASHHPDFCEHPPLMIGMLAALYSLLGARLWVTRLYCVLAVLFGAWLTVRLWKRFGHRVADGWLPLLLCTLVPVVSHYATECMIEYTLLIFDMGAILMLLRPQREWWAPVAAGLLLAAAFMTKGFVGLFPLVLPLLLWMFDRKGVQFGAMLMQTVLMTVALIAPLCAVVLMVPEASSYWQGYWHSQVFAAFSRGEVHRWQIIIYFLRNAAVVAAAVAVVAIVGKGVNRPSRQESALWCLLACAVLPIMLSTRQHGFYIVTVMPLFAILSAALIETTVERWKSALPSWVMPVVTCCALATAVLLNVLHYGKYGRDAQLQADMEHIAPLLEDGEYVTVPTELYYEYKLQGYYYREKRIALGDQWRCRHLIVKKGMNIDSSYREVPLTTKEYKLFEKTID